MYGLVCVRLQLGSGYPMPSSHDVISWLDTLQAAWPAGGAAGAAGDAHAQQDGHLHRHWLPGQQEDRRGGHIQHLQYLHYSVCTTGGRLGAAGWAGGVAAAAPAPPHHPAAAEAGPGRELLHPGRGQRGPRPRHHLQTTLGTGHPARWFTLIMYCQYY